MICPLWKVVREMNMNIRLQSYITFTDWRYDWTEDNQTSALWTNTKKWTNKQSSLQTEANKTILVSNMIRHWHLCVRLFVCVRVCISLK